MVRPRKCRRVCCEPFATYFKPRGVPLTALEKVSLTVDELEAVRLKDLERIDQEQAALSMKVSQPTFHRILESAHNKIADGLVRGKAIRIEGGNYMISEGERLFECCDCQNEWQEPYGTGRPTGCPKCKGLNIHRAQRERGCAGRGRSGGWETRTRLR
jgi:predicted DNA-binding protein (UPF0251 family)